MNKNEKNSTSSSRPYKVRKLKTCSWEKISTKGTIATAVRTACPKFAEPKQLEQTWVLVKCRSEGKVARCNQATKARWKTNYRARTQSPLTKRRVDGEAQPGKRHLSSKKKGEETKGERVWAERPSVSEAKLHCMVQ